MAWATFPKPKGFSARNLWNMKKWYLFYSSNEAEGKLQQLVAELQQTDNKKKQNSYKLLENLQKNLKAHKQSFTLNKVTKCGDLLNIYYLCLNIL